MDITKPNNQRRLLRRQLREQRRALTRQQQQQAALGLYQTINHSGLLNRYHHIAFYLANDGEIDPQLILEQAYQRGHRCYLPVLAPTGKLWFVHYRPGDPLRTNQFGIPEPINQSARIPSWALGLVLMPLVGFDCQGGRLGMGGGFYDKAFESIKRIPQMKQAKLVGVAHHCQQVKSLALQRWDIPLSMIATDKEFIVVSKSSN